ncbi:ImmA/IrrE family metallo-endopeptidase [Microbacterium halophytorum]|uniref:ImmA/IrrE family metallo-endopeptidase n=1 Tax=Microbacterium halophytorum TaxID=2067568 RepID=UPI000CFC3992|nr:ImmA/IrrE family metallo-endopeptidase [Microbacterium halophytorum]
MLVDHSLLDATRSTGYMYGVRLGWTDGPCASDYDPHHHASELGLPVIYRDLPHPEMVAAYSAEHDAVFVRPSLHTAVERCAIAHEIVHFEHNDVGTTPAQEQRADRIAARRLIRKRRIAELARLTDDLAQIALELNVTEHMMRVYLKTQAGPYRSMSL